MKSLTESQRKIFEYLKKTTTKGIPPSVREICVATGLSSTSSVHAHLKSLEKLGYIERIEGLNRNIKIVGAEPVTQVPILGTVTAGSPILAFEENLGYLPFADNSDKDFFALKIKGYSMKDIGILDGDYVVAEKTSVAKNGEIVVALIEDEATVKTFYIENGKIRLQPENEEFEAIYPEKCEVLGKVVSLNRSYR